jgi:hypothetical protein
MKVGKEDRTGGASHYPLVLTGSDLPEPTDRFQNFVDELQLHTVSTALTLGPFQRRLQRTLTEAASHAEQSAVPTDGGSDAPAQG